MLNGNMVGKIAIIASKVAIIILEIKFTPPQKTVKVIKYQLTTVSIQKSFIQMIYELGTSLLYTGCFVEYTIIQDS